MTGWRHTQAASATTGQARGIGGAGPSPDARRQARPGPSSRWDTAWSPLLVRTVRALALTRRPISARSLAGSYRTAPTLAALRWLAANGFVGSGTSHVNGKHTRPVPVYWLTDDGTRLHRRLRAATETHGRLPGHRETDRDPNHPDRKGPPTGAR